MKENLYLRPFSSLAKIFADEKPVDRTYDTGTMLKNEVYAFQIGYYWSGALKKGVQISVSSELASKTQIRLVGLIPSEMPCYADHDEDILRNYPGLYPDILIPMDEEGIALLPNQWRSLWITVNPEAENLTPGTYPMGVSFNDDSGKSLGKLQFNLEIINAVLPNQKLIHTEWFHTDCIATYYNLDIFSEKHWEHIEQFIQTASRHGINMILTPLFTPPLDTKVGGERPTVQLVDVEKKGDKYSFVFDKLKRWIDLCRNNGIEFFEFSHLFTQWGAKHAPKIVAIENGKKRKIFGWDTNAAGEAYTDFLSQFLPELLIFIKNNSLEKASYFHVSDEPFLEHCNEYKKASDIINSFLEGYPIIDALSDYEFYETGIVKNPIPANNHIEPFIKNNVPNLWTYYCCMQYKKVANRFFNMPSSRSRILGIQLYKFNIKGFLHWGYNFWYSQHSKHPIDPFRVSDAGYAFPSGDAYIVYPGINGPLESIRLEVMYEALQDLRVLELLETKIGREAVIELLEEGLEQPITFSEYPRGEQWLLSKREQINRILSE
jgi:hypothetical protein